MIPSHRTRLDHTRRATALGAFPAVLILASLAGCADAALEAESLAELVDEAVALDLPGIIVLVDAPGQANDFAGAGGFADVAGRVPMMVDAGFRIASNSKAFVGLAAASMVVDGLLDLDAPLSTLVDGADLAGINNAEGSTLRQAFQHTSGIVDYLDPDGFWDAVDAGRDTRWTIRDALTFARDEHAYFATGSGWEYSNTNYLLAALAMERGGGRTWAQEVRERVLDPLGLTTTFVENQEPARNSIVHGYAEAERDVYAIDTGYGLPDGGIVATAAELSVFVRAVGGGEAGSVDPEAIALLFDALADAGDGERYGLGISRFDTVCGDTIGHGGGIDGYLSEMFYLPAIDTTVIVFVNASDAWVDDLFAEVVDHALQLVCGAE